MITGKQIRAARVLLEWDAEDLATYTGLNRETVFNIERGTVQARSNTLEKIIRVFNENGVEFLDNQGVRFSPEGVDVLNGQEGLSTFLDEVYNHLSAHGGVVSVTDVDEKKWISIYGKENSAKHFSRMEALVNERNDVKIRSLTREGFHPTSTSAYTEYRWIGRDRFSTVPFYLCGDKLGIIIFQSDPPPKIILIRSQVVADAYRQQFDGLWQVAKEFASQARGKNG